MSENHEITRQYNEILRKVKETDEVHADFVNTIYSQLINNDAYLKVQDLITENNVKQYVDQQIQLVTETGIPKLMCYSYLLKATEDNQTVFEIPLSTFDKNTDTVFVIQNTSFRNEEEHYSIEGSTITLNEGVRENTSIAILILKNVPIGEEGSVSGKVIADGSLELKKLDTEVAKKNEMDDLIARIGSNEELNTEEKTKIILALNEVNNKVDMHKADYDQLVNTLKKENVYQHLLDGYTIPVDTVISALEFLVYTVDNEFYKIENGELIAKKRIVLHLTYGFSNDKVRPMSFKVDFGLIAGRGTANYYNNPRNHTETIILAHLQPIILNTGDKVRVDISHSYTEPVSIYSYASFIHFLGVYVREVIA